LSLVVRKSVDGEDAEEDEECCPVVGERGFQLVHGGYPKKIIKDLILYHGVTEKRRRTEIIEFGFKP
jgi:hypothetical protein